VVFESAGAQIQVSSRSLQTKGATKQIVRIADQRATSAFLIRKDFDLQVEY
jgi:hypothetical protein